MAQIFKKWTSIIFPFVMAVAIGFMLFFAMWYLLNLPSDGMDWLRIDGKVQSVNPLGPASESVAAGDVILRIDGLPASQSAHIYRTKQPGNILHFTLERQGKVIQTDVILVRPDGAELFHRFAPILVAFSFLFIGVAVKAFAPSSHPTNLFFLLCMFGSGILASGSMSARGPQWASTIFNVLLWWIGPLAVHLHLHFPEARPRSLRWAVGMPLYSIAAIGCLPYLLLGASRLHVSEAYRLLYAAGRISLILNMLFVVTLLITSYWRSANAMNRQKIRLVTFFVVISLLMVTSLTILPGAILLQPILPYETSFLFLLLIPLAYSYAILRYRLDSTRKVLKSRGGLRAGVLDLDWGIPGPHCHHQADPALLDS